MTKKHSEFISRFWVHFKFYRKHKGGTWYLIQWGDETTDRIFTFWDRNPPHPSKQYHETLLKTEVY